MFSESHNDQYRRIGDRADANRLRDRNNVAGIGDNSAEIGDNSTEIGDDAAYLRKSDPMLNSVLNRFGKSTHISMISNSVTHLQSYTNSAIADNSAPILPVRIKRRYHRIE